ncbi:MAG: hypothetical protein NTX53_05590 [candidate division WOR-3 bacterium]|nr:hypothetical protein [candidate division WOR-3 bacterium]
MAAKRINERRSDPTGAPARPGRYEPGCIIHDATVFIGLASLPHIFQAGKFNGELHEFFKKYHEDLLEHQRKSDDPARKELEDHFYKPATYVLLAPFDFAAIALTDDYDLGALEFHALNSYWPDGGVAAQRGFYHQSIMGPLPDFPKFGEDGKPVKRPGSVHSAPVRLALDTFLSPNPLPLIGICQLKLQNGMLIGSGADFLRCAVKATKRHFDFAYRDRRNRPRAQAVRGLMQLVIVESCSWHELTLLVFGESFEDIMRFVIDIREMTVGRMREILKDEHENDTTAKLSDEKDIERFDNAQTLTRMYCGKTGSGCGEASHIFWNSTTSLGMRSELCFPNPEQAEAAKAILSRVSEKDNLCWARRWNTRAGHLGDALRKLLQVPEPEQRSDDFRICTGRGDFVWPLLTTNDAQGNSRKLVDSFVALFAQEGELDRVDDHIFSLQTTVGAKVEGVRPIDKLRQETALPPVNEDTHPWINKVLRQLLPLPSVGLTSTRIRDDVLVPLRKLRAPQVVTERLLNACALLAEGLEDQFLVSSMLELLPYMQAVRRRLSSEEFLRAAQSGSVMQSPDIDEWFFRARQAVKLGAAPRLEAVFGPGRENTSYNVGAYLNELADVFEWAWHNRFRVGWRLGEVSDFNLEYKGGIQQLTSAFDGAYKSLSLALAGTDAVVAIVTSDPDIVSTLHSVRLSFLDIYRPEFFAARAAHEAAEQILSRDADSALARDLRDHYPQIAAFTFADETGEGPANFGPEVMVEFFDWARTENQIEPSYLTTFEEFCLRFIRPRFLENVFADICNYATVYLENPRLYAYWFKGCFTIDSGNWLRGGATPNSDALKSALLRLALVVYRDDQRGSDIDAKRQAQLANAAAAAYIGRMWSELGGGVVDCAEFFGDAMEFARLVHTYPGGLRMWFQEARRWTRDKLLWDSEVAFVRKAAHEAILRMQQGRVPGAPSGRAGASLREIEELRRRQFHHVLAVSHAFLLLLMGRSSMGERRRLNALHRRGGEGQAVKGADVLPTDSYLLFDSRGRTFTWDPAFRRQYLRFRNVYTASLWDLSAKAKVWMPELAEAVAKASEEQAR